jgi:hypothetical protein
MRIGVAISIPNAATRPSNGGVSLDPTPTISITGTAASSIDVNSNATIDPIVWQTSTDNVTFADVALTTASGTISGLDPTISHYIREKQGTSGWSNVIRVLPSPQNPAGQDNGDGSAAITFDSNSMSGVDSVHAYLASDNSEIGSAASSPSAGTMTLSSGLGGQDIYLKFSNSGGNAPGFPSATFTVAFSPPTAPTSLVVTPDAFVGTLAQGIVSPATPGGIVYHFELDDGGGWVEVGTCTGTDTFDYTGLTPNTLYHSRVYARDSGSGLDSTKTTGNDFTPAWPTLSPGSIQQTSYDSGNNLSTIDWATTPSGGNGSYTYDIYSQGSLYSANQTFPTAITASPGDTIFIRVTSGDGQSGDTPPITAG